MPYICTRNQEIWLHSSKTIAEIAQLVEHNLAKVGVASSSLVFRSKYFSFLPPAEIAQLVEHNLAKVGVASSSLVFRSKAESLQ